MSEIKLLDKNTIDQIAAGEVVERPSSIVKELVENAIDAGATAISVEIKNGGKSLVRITDNGGGIPKDQVRKAFLRHSTSKINDASDLSFIHTLGFRGEALSSIAAVARTQLYTKTEDEITGVIYKINGGEEESLEEAGLPEGTTVIIRDLFYNTPARLKFLKSDTTEGNYILDVVQKIALSRPDISFKFTSNGAVRLATPGNGSLKDTVYSIFGRDITTNLLDVDETYGNLQISGFVGKPEIARGNRNFELFFVNGRFVRDKIIQRALEDAYVGYQMKGTFPFALLNITLEPELVDVNVHPSKMEIRFYNNEEVFHSIYEVIRNRITKRESIPQAKVGNEEKEENRPKEKVSVPEPFEQHVRKQAGNGITQESILHDGGIRYSSKLQEPASSYHQDRSLKPNDSLDYPRDRETPKDISKSIETMVSLSNIMWKNDAVSEGSDAYEQTSLDAPQFLSVKARIKHRIVGEVFDTYWVVEYDQKLFIIDQHAAHEKVLYERFMKRLEQETHYSQQITPVEIVTLSREEEEILNVNLETFRKIGFEIEPFGGNEYAIGAVPTDIYGIDHKILFMQMIEDLKDVSARSGAQILTDRVATAACKAAVKGGNRLSLAEADQLIDELLGLDNPYNCPHGRPTIISMSKYELEKKFKRVI